MVMVVMVVAAGDDDKGGGGFPEYLHTQTSHQEAQAGRQAARQNQGDKHDRRRSIVLLQQDVSISGLPPSIPSGPTTESEMPFHPH